MGDPSARHELVCTIVQRHPDAVIRLAGTVGVRLPEHDQVLAAPDAHRMRHGAATIHTDSTVRLLLKGKPVFFATVEMQRRFDADKYATLYAYHGSGVRNVTAGGHLFVLSDQASEAARFRAEDSARRADYAFAASFHSGRDLRQMEDAKMLGARALSAALADFRNGVPERALALLEEMTSTDLTLADLYFWTIVEEVPDVTMVGEALRPDIFERLRGLESFRDYEAKVKAEGKAELKAETEAATRADDLKEFLVLRGDAPSEHALDTISACRKADLLAAWLKRAYLGETSAQLFPEPKPQTR